MKRRRFKIITALVPIVTMVIYIWIIRYMMIPDHSRAQPSPLAVIHLQTLATVILVSCIVSIGASYYIWFSKSTLTETRKNFLLSFFVFIMSLLRAECFFLHYARSNAMGIRWSYRLWDKKYLHRTGFSYLDSKGQKQRADLREPVMTIKSRKKPIWFIGDSFTFGFGLEQTDQTFPALVERPLKKEAYSINLGEGGADTYREKETLMAFEHAVGKLPYAIVWQYFGNDIDHDDVGEDVYDKKMANNKWLNFGKRFFEAKSFLLDYIYWEYFTGNERGAKNTYIDFLEHAYKADSIIVDGKVLKDSLGNISPFRKHLLPLKGAAAYYQSKGVKFLVIIFPYLWKDGPERAERLYGNRLAKELNAENIATIDLAPLVKNIPVEKREVNSHDLHPSPMIDVIVADTITKYLKAKYDL